MRNDEHQALATGLSVLIAEDDPAIEVYRPSERPTQIDGELVDAERDVVKEGEGTRVLIVQGAKRSPSKAMLSALRALCDDQPPAKAICILYEEERRPFERLLVCSCLPTLGESSPEEVKSILRGGGYETIADFQSRQRIGDANCFYRLNSRRFVLPHTASRVETLVNYLGVKEHWYLPTKAIIAVRAESSSFPVHSLLARTRPDTPIFEPRGKCRIVQFMYRERGTFLLFLNGPSDKGQVVAKFSARDETVQSLKDSYVHQKWLRRQVGKATRAAIPRPIEYRDRTDKMERALYIEEMKEGVLAWKVNEGARASRLEKGALEFLQRLQDRTRNSRRCTDRLLNKVLASISYAAATQLWNGDYLYEALRRLARSIHEYHMGRSVGFVASHGDFGIGNVLVDEGTGAPTAIVDWADGRRVEFPTVDPFNWAIQQRRDHHGENFREAIDSLKTQITNGSLVVPPSFLVETRSPQLAQLAGLHTAVFRYVERSLKYPWAFYDDCGSPRQVAKSLRKLVMSSWSA